MYFYRFFALLILIVAFFHNSAAQAGFVTPGVYWVDSGFGAHSPVRVLRTSLDGSGGINQIQSGSFTDLRDIAIDFATGKIYLTDHTAVTGNRIFRGYLDGSGLTTLVDNIPTEGIWQIDLATIAGKMYWVESQTGDPNRNRVRRANLDGTNVESVVSGLSGLPTSLVLDERNNHVYFGIAGGDLLRADLDGSNLTTILTNADARYLALDSLLNQLYWRTGDDRIVRANLDGTGLKSILSGLTRPRGIDLDLTTSKIYWSEAMGNPPSSNPNTHRIRRANLDGSDVETLVTGLNAPFGIAVAPVPEPATFVLCGIGTIVIGLGYLFPTISRQCLRRSDHTQARRCQSSTSKWPDAARP